MGPNDVIHIGREALETALLVSAPALAVGLAIGLGVAMIQAVTSVRDMTLGVVFKLAGVGVTMLLAGGWMMQRMVGFTRMVFTYMASSS